MRGISGQSSNIVLTSQPGLRNLLDPIFRGQTKKTEILVNQPQIPSRVLGDGVHVSARNAADRSKLAIFQVADPGKCREEDR
jgi:hypothetical protein